MSSQKKEIIKRAKEDSQFRRQMISHLQKKAGEKTFEEVITEARKLWFEKMFKKFLFLTSQAWEVIYKKFYHQFDIEMINEFSKKQIRASIYLNEHGHHTQYTIFIKFKDSLNRDNILKVEAWDLTPEAAAKEIFEKITEM